jgi:hypothetical protein
LLYLDRHGWGSGSVVAGSRGRTTARLTDVDGSGQSASGRRIAVSNSWERQVCLMCEFLDLAMRRVFKNNNMTIMTIASHIHVQQSDFARVRARL